MEANVALEYIEGSDTDEEGFTRRHEPRSAASRFRQRRLANDAARQAELLAAMGELDRSFLDRADINESLEILYPGLDPARRRAIALTRNNPTYTAAILDIRDDEDSESLSEVDASPPELPTQSSQLEYQQLQQYSRLAALNDTLSPAQIRADRAMGHRRTPPPLPPMDARRRQIEGVNQHQSRSQTQRDAGLPSYLRPRRSPTDSHRLNAQLDHLQSLTESLTEYDGLLSNTERLRNSAERLRDTLDAASTTSEQLHTSGSSRGLRPSRGSRHRPSSRTSSQYLPRAEAQVQSDLPPPPHASFTLPPGKSGVQIKFESPIAGRFVLFKLCTWPNESCLDIRSVALYGFAGLRAIPKTQLR
jgi:hypothetical protein